MYNNKCRFVRPLFQKHLGGLTRRVFPRSLVVIEAKVSRFVRYRELEQTLAVGLWLLHQRRLFSATDTFRAFSGATEPKLPSLASQSHDAKQFEAASGWWRRRRRE
jgi:hypothetical protein